MSEENIFSALAKYNSARDENYLTEAFVFLINSLFTRERTIGLEILTQLCVKNNEFCFETDEPISISTQEITEQGTPDIKISSPDKLIYIEVKQGSDLGAQQLERYRKALGSSDATIKHVVLLTRFAIDFEEKIERPYKHIRWFEVYNWLANSRTRAKNPVSVYLIDSFNSFLEAKQMSIEKVGWEYINGVPAFNNLINMIEAAIKAADIPFYTKYPRAVAWDWKAFWLGNKEFWCGIYHNTPLVVVFKVFDKKTLNPKLIEMPSYPLKEAKLSYWFCLQLEDKHFFSLDKDKQLEEITKFVKTAYAEAQLMRIKEE